MVTTVIMQPITTVIKQLANGGKVMHFDGKQLRELGFVSSDAELVSTWFSSFIPGGVPTRVSVPAGEKFFETFRQKDGERVLVKLGSGIPNIHGLPKIPLAVVKYKNLSEETILVLAPREMVFEIGTELI
jgi:hypothetical protein